MRKLIIGSRGSKLAMAQSTKVAASLGIETEIKRITTRGDKIQDVALAKLEGKGFFTKEIDDALLSEEIDLAVHSFKDVPTEIPEGIIIAAIPKRESPRDTLVGPYSSFDDLPLNAKVGTASIRRKAIALSLRPDLDVQDLRGNLDTRVRKQSEGHYDTIIVAEAGLKRLGYSESEYHPLDPLAFVPAAGQGAIAITARENDDFVLEKLATLEDGQTRIASEAERQFIQTLEGGCQVPAGIYTVINDKTKSIELNGFISSLDGKFMIRETSKGPTNKSIDMSNELAQKLLDAGGCEILEKIKQEGF